MERWYSWDDGNMVLVGDIGLGQVHNSFKTSRRKCSSHWELIQLEGHFFQSSDIFGANSVHYGITEHV